MSTDADDDKVYMPIAKSPNMLEPAKWMCTTRKHAKGPPQKYRYEDKPVPILDGTYGRALRTGW